MRRLKECGLRVVLNPHARKLTEAETAALMKAHTPVGIIAGVESLTAQLLGGTPELKAISRCGVGMDTVDVDAAAQMGIGVTNTPEAPVLPVAELTLGLMLSMLRGIHGSHRSIHAGGWHRPMGGLLAGKCVGIVGLGRIGTKLSELLAPFGCTILGCDNGPVDDIPPGVDLVDLNRLLCRSDVVSLHVPAGDENHHLLDEEKLALMKPGAFLINAARGGLVDEKALYRMLVSGRLAGAALDTFEEEPYRGPLRELDQVLLTAHIGSYAAEGRMMMESQAVENLIHSLGLEG